ncbi:NF038122 family metalloprotease [Mycobacterium sp. DL592]|uniref:NF038122 family metalloprotease n=1 Tax=Mycobacterium sp. DL592 TaxID=2675524 RepID=UPI00141F5274|nr:NF038122 family metalloprotease [Mycobacterium sp. DL592]
MPFAWLGTGALALGLGAAMASGTGVAHADNTASTGHTGKPASSTGSDSAKRSGKATKVAEAVVAVGGPAEPSARPAASTGGNRGPGSVPITTEAASPTTPRPTTATAGFGPSSAELIRPTRPATPTVTVNPLLGVVTGVLSAFGLNGPAEPANPLGAVAWIVLRAVETSAGLTPVAGTPTIGTPNSATGTVTGTTGFTEPAGQPLNYSVTTDPALGSVTLTPAGGFTYTPTVAIRLATTDTFTVTASDGLAATSESVTVPVPGQASSAVISPSGLVIHLIWDSSVAKAPASFKAAVEQAAQMLESTVTNNVTLNIAVGYGEIGGSSIGSGSAEGATLGDQQESYAVLRSQLTACDTTAIGRSVVAYLPATNPFGSLSYDVSGAQLQVFGVDPANSPQLDGEVGFSTDWPTAELLAAALHELTHAMGRNSGWGSAVNGYDVTPLDLTRYSALGLLVCDGSLAPSTRPQYFSVDGGATALADYSNTSDYGDWATNSLTFTDPYDAYSNPGSNSLTAADVAVLDAIGYTTI